MASFIPCLNTISLKQVPILERIDLAAEIGYKAIEPWNTELEGFVAEGGSLNEIAQRLQAHGLEVPNVIALHSWMNTRGAERDHAFEEAKRRMDQARALGARHVCASPPMAEVDLDLAAENYHALCELGRQHGVPPALEYLGFVHGVKDIRTAHAILQKANHPDATVVHDFFHMYNGGSKPEDIRLIPGSQIAVVHLDDAPAHIPAGQIPDSERVWPGDGVCPLRQMCDLLIEVGYHGPLSLELLTPAYWEMDGRQAARLGWEKSKPLFA